VQCCDPLARKATLAADLINSCQTAGTGKDQIVVAAKADIGFGHFYRQQSGGKRTICFGVRQAQNGLTIWLQKRCRTPSGKTALEA